MRNRNPNSSAGFAPYVGHGREVERKQQRHRRRHERRPLEGPASSLARARPAIMSPANAASGNSRNTPIASGTLLALRNLKTHPHW